MGLQLGRCVLGCVLTLAMGACAGAHTTSPPAISPAIPSSSSSGAAATTTHDNVVATRQFSSWLLHAVSMPHGAREWSHSPTSHYRHGSVGIGPADPDFTRTTWWTLSLSPEAFASWLRGHVPRGLRVDSDSGGSVESSGVWEQDQDFHAPGTPAHTEGWVNFAFMRQADGLVVRVDTFVGARFARTVMVPADTTSVAIRRTERSFRPNSRPHTAARTVTDPRSVAHLVEMINHLPGAMTTPFVASCPAALEQTSYSMTFTDPHGTYVASLPTTSCWPQLTLTHNGAPAGPPLDPGRRFAKTADLYLA